MNAEIEFDEATGALLDISGAFSRANKETVIEGSLIVQRRARAKHAFRTHTGAAEKAVSTAYGTEDGNDVGYTFLDNDIALHAMFMHEGTKPHPITARNKKSLRWAVPGGFAFAKKVSHPGTKADPFLYDAVDDSRAQVENLFMSYVDDVIQESGFA